MGLVVWRARDPETLPGARPERLGVVPLDWEAIAPLEMLPTV
jgi:hypothetical protein